MKALSAPASFEPVIHPHDIAVRAKRIFCERYHYPAIPFASIGKPCLAWSRIEAHRQLIEEARDRARLDAMSIDDLRAERDRLRFEAWRQPISQSGNAEMVNLLRAARELDAEIEQRARGNDR